ncbi:MAG: hypothetical protein AAF517_21135 [Planctomycetota bacterium]
MSPTRSLAIPLFAAFGLTLLFPAPAYAYLDPGTGSMILQAIVAGILGGLMAIKLFWRRIFAFFAGLVKREEPERDEVVHTADD